MDEVSVATIRRLAGRALAEDDLDAKARAVAQLADLVADADASRALTADDDARLPLVPVERPGRPARPALVPPRQLPRRRTTTVEGRIATIHAVAHIEANAVNLALDASHRFAGLPPAFHVEWVGVAAEEVAHLALLQGRLHDLGASYGDLPAHDGLWQAAVRTADDPLQRMALVPRVLEARGLDVTPGMIERFEAAHDTATAAVLRRILADEVGHVAIGDRWFRWLCRRAGRAPEATFRALLDEAGVRVTPPLNHGARRAAGFSAAELVALGT